MTRSALLVLGAALAGCTQTGISVDLVIDPGCASQATAIAVTVTASPSEMARTQFVSDVPSFFTNGGHVLILPPDGTTEIDVMVTATRDKGLTVAGQAVENLSIAGAGSYAAPSLTLAMCNQADGPRSDFARLTDASEATDAAPTDLLGARMFAHSANVPKVTLRGVWGSAPNDVFVVGYGGTLLHSTDAGLSWAPPMTLVLPNSKPDLYGVSGSSANEFVVVGNGYIINILDDVAAKITTAPVQVLSVAVTAQGTGFAVGQEGLLEISSVPNTWTVVQSELATPLNHVLVLPNLQGFAVGGAGKLLRLTLGGKVSPTTIGNGANLNGISGTGTLLVVGDGGLILRSQDLGTTWQPIASGVVVPLYQVWASGEEAWAVGASSTILHSSDGGVTWTSELSIVNGASFYDVWAASDGTVYVVGEDGTLLHSP